MSTTEPHLVPNAGSPEPLGASRREGGINFAVYSEHATRIEICVFDGDIELARIPLDGHENHVWFGLIDLDPGLTYGLRADGPFDPAQGLHFDPDKLLVDPYAIHIDRIFKHHERLAMPRGEAGDTAALMPKAHIEPDLPDPIEPMEVKRGGLTYELNVRSFTMLHPEVETGLRGTVAGLVAPAVIEHLEGLGVDIVELMPVAAWMDERHLLPLGLVNAWGYNPVGYFLPSPRRMPGGIAELRAMTDAYRAAGMPVILDVVYNHTGEGDTGGPVLSMKGLDALTYYRHAEADGKLVMINDSGTGNTLQCDHPAVMALVLDSLKFWVQRGGVSGFRFDLAPILGKDDNGFVSEAPLLEAMRTDPVLSRCYLSMEPWDASGLAYHLGDFGEPFAEWNDRYRDDVRAFWRGDDHTMQDFATRVAGSADIFGGKDLTPAASVNMIAIHDGFTLADLVSYADKHNEPNGEENRDGHSHNLSWNNGAEGPTGDPDIAAARKRDVRALLATLFTSLGTPMVQQGDEMGRTQQGMNNAYAQDNEITWVDWERADFDLVAYTGALKRFRDAHPAFAEDRFLTGEELDGVRDAIWWHRSGREMAADDWHRSDAGIVGMHLARAGDEVLVWYNRRHEDKKAALPPMRLGQGRWQIALSSVGQKHGHAAKAVTLPARSVTVLVPDQA